MSGESPLLELLANNKGETILDKHYQNVIAPKIERGKQHKEAQSPPKSEESEAQKNDEGENEELPIGLQHRQPSFTSLHGNLIGKDGVPVHQLPDLDENDDNNNNMNIVLDENDDSTDAPIGLTYRQPSFNSLNGHLVSKDGNLVSDIHSVKTGGMEEIVEEKSEENENENNEDNDDDEDFPQVQIVKELRNKNMERWQKMGYEPPPDLIQLTRAHSQSIFNQNQIIQNSQNQKPKNILPLLEEEPAPSPLISASSDNQNAKKSPIKVAHRRCGSNGMKLGEASTSLVRMSQALMMDNDYNQKKNKSEESEESEEEEEENNEEDSQDASQSSQNSEQSSDQEDQNSNEEYSESSESNSEQEIQSDLYGKLGQIVKEKPSSEIYKSIKAGRAIKGVNYKLLKERIDSYLEMCIERLWIDETSYLNKIKETIPQNQKKQRSISPSSGRISDLKGHMKQSEAKYATKIENAKQKLNAMLDLLNDEYREASLALDAKFHSQQMLNKFNAPSPTLVELREKVKSQLRSKNYEAAKALSGKVASLENKEAREASDRLNQLYLEEDRLLKIQFSMRRDLLVRKINYEIDLLEEKCDVSQKKYHSLLQSSKGKSGSKHSPREESKPLNIKAPQRPSRENDEKIIELMADHLSAGKDVRNLDIENLFRRKSSPRRSPR